MTNPANPQKEGPIKIVKASEGPFEVAEFFGERVLIDWDHREKSVADLNRVLAPLVAKAELAGKMREFFRKVVCEHYMDRNGKHINKCEKCGLAAEFDALSKQSDKEGKK